MTSYHSQPRPSLQSRTLSSSSAQSHQTGAIKEHWNDIPAGFTPSASRNASRNVSRTGTPQPPRNGSSTVVSDHKNEIGFDHLISTLLSLPTDAPPAELKLCASRIQKALPGITAEQRAAFSLVIKAVAIDKAQSPAWGREQIVDLMMREKGIAGWASAIRRVVESVRLD